MYKKGTSIFYVVQNALTLRTYIDNTVRNKEKYKIPMNSVYHVDLCIQIFSKLENYYYNFLCVNFFHATHKKGQIY